MIQVVVVESHHHVLEHIHHVLRKRRLLNQDWSMLHFDAHADLACPNVPAVACFQPRRTIRLDSKSSIDDSSVESDGEGRNLYESLDATTSGIAEWIIPLVMAANLRRIHWVRPPGTIPLIPAGNHQYHVGAWLPPSDQNRSDITSFLDLPLSATTKVDFVCSYYQEDDSCVPFKELLLPQPLHLVVSEGPQMHIIPDSSVQNIDDRYEENCLLMFDICLDYFLCVNPFLRDMELIDRNFTQAFQRMITLTKFYNESTTSEIGGNIYQQDVFTFRQCIKCLLESCYTQSHSSILGLSGIVDSLIPFYSSAEVTAQLVKAIHTAFLELKAENESETLIKMAVEAIPNATMPHRYLSGNNSDDNGEVQEMLQRFRQTMHQSNKTEPFIITVARSAEDGFTPKEIVDELQAAVLQEIHSRYCGCDNDMTLSRWLEKPEPSQSQSSSRPCRLQVAFDFGFLESKVL
jgi:UPF0489 domain